MKKLLNIVSLAAIVVGLFSVFTPATSQADPFLDTPAKVFQAFKDNGGWNAPWNANPVISRTARRFITENATVITARELQLLAQPPQPPLSDADVFFLRAAALYLEQDPDKWQQIIHIGGDSFADVVVGRITTPEQYAAVKAQGWKYVGVSFAEHADWILALRAQSRDYADWPASDTRAIFAYNDTPVKFDRTGAYAGLLGQMVVGKSDTERFAIVNAEVQKFSSLFKGNDGNKAMNSNTEQILVMLHREQLKLSKTLGVPIPPVQLNP